MRRTALGSGGPVGAPLKGKTDSFDLVHTRYEICPLGRAHEQMETYMQLARPGGTIVLEDPDTGSWYLNPPAPALERPIALIEEAFLASGGDWKAGRNHLHLLREFGIEGSVRAEVLALPPGHPYLRLPLQFATALEERLLSLVSAEELEGFERRAPPNFRSLAAGAPRSRYCSAGAGARRRSEGVAMNPIAADCSPVANGRAKQVMLRAA